jgi:hypothetical protein
MKHGWLGVGVAMTLAAAADARAQPCRIVDVDLVPTADLQIVGWIEDAAGNYVDTIFITQETGLHGLGNRPGVQDMRTGPRWPYGPRRDVFPVWAHKHGLTWPVVMFQNGDGDVGLDGSDPDRNLSHPFLESSQEVHHCRPIRPDEDLWDSGSCATPVFTDKGRLSPNYTSRYPPRSDVARAATDHVTVDMFPELNPFDTISMATPPPDAPWIVTWPITPGLPAGDYVIAIEVSKERDFNSEYNESTYPPIAASAFEEYGVPYHGQPSVVYRVPFQIQDGEFVSHGRTESYAGYGDPDGLDGDLRVPDTTITVDVPGSGALRLGLAVDDVSGGMYRARVFARYELDPGPPAEITDAAAIRVDNISADIAFTSPGDDDLIGEVAGFEIRYRPNIPITPETFETALPIDETVARASAGEMRTFELHNLLPSTNYYVGLRAYDNCRNYSTLSVIEFVTAERVTGEVDACFVATAAYGTAMVNDVDMLRRMRDVVLKSNVVGELAVEAYYTFGPILAGVIGESELLRDTAREALEPVVERVRTMRY